MTNQNQTITLRKKVYASGSHGIYAPLRRDGSSDRLVRIWTAYVGSTLVGHFRTRDEARDAAWQHRARATT